MEINLTAQSHFVQCWPRHGGKCDVKRCVENDRKNLQYFCFTDVFAGDFVY